MTVDQLTPADRESAQLHYLRAYLGRKRRAWFASVLATRYQQHVTRKAPIVTANVAEDLRAEWPRICRLTEAKRQHLRETA